MSTQARALAIGLLGPSVAAMGGLWLTIDTLVAPRTGKFGLHYLMFNAPHLVIAAGIALSFLAIPLAIRVAVATRAEVEIPIFDRDLELEGEEFQAQPEAR